MKKKSARESGRVEKTVKGAGKKGRKYRQNNHGLPVYPGWIVPWAELARPLTLNQEAYRVFFLLLRMAGKHGRGHNLVIVKERLQAWQIKERTFRTSLNRLSKNGLIRVRRRHGKPPVIDLICIAPADPDNPFKTEREIRRSVVKSYRFDIRRGHAPAPQYETTDDGAGG
ncbi:MAG: hypothetical protein R3C05_09425 [Pirellulaceae bacterium]